MASRSLCRVENVPGHRAASEPSPANFSVLLPVAAQSPCLPRRFGATGDIVRACRFGKYPAQSKSGLTRAAAQSAIEVALFLRRQKPLRHHHPIEKPANL